MIIVKLTGGLGNQMFCYAAGRSLAEIHNTDLRIDLSDYADNDLRQYELKVFNIKENIVTEEQLAAFRPKKNKLIPKFIRKHLNTLPRNYIKEKYFSFDPKILNSPDNVYLDGYWQSEKYFKNIEDTIRQEFTFKIKPINEDLFHQISNDNNAVSLHIRRGDYVTNPIVNKVHGLCDIEYYEKAIQIIEQEVQNPSFYIFSDEPEWVKEQFKINYQFVIVDYNKDINAYEDMRLMSLCKHNIIANSSFSWWGAWLNNNPDKIIIAPQRWFNHSKHNTKDLLPENWIKL